MSPGHHIGTIITIPHHCIQVIPRSGTVNWKNMAGYLYSNFSNNHQSDTNLLPEYWRKEIIKLIQVTWIWKVFKNNIGFDDIHALPISLAYISLAWVIAQYVICFWMEILFRKCKWFYRGITVLLHHNKKTDVTQSLHKCKANTATDVLPSTNISQYHNIITPVAPFTNMV